MQVKSKWDLKVKRVCRRGKFEKRWGVATTGVRVDMETVKCEMDKKCQGETSVIKINCQLILYERVDVSEPKIKKEKPQQQQRQPLTVK